MTEYIDKAELIRACNYTVCYEDDEETFGISEARIDLMPTTDIVHCSECKWFDEGYTKCKMGNINGGNKTYFCADGERRTENE